MRLNTTKEYSQISSLKELKYAQRETQRELDIVKENLTQQSEEILNMFSFNYISGWIMQKVMVTNNFFEAIIKGFNFAKSIIAKFKSHTVEKDNTSYEDDQPQ